MPQEDVAASSPLVPPVDNTKRHSAGASTCRNIAASLETEAGPEAETGAFPTVSGGGEAWWAGSTCLKLACTAAKQANQGRAR